MDYTVAPVLLLLAVIVPTKTLQASLIMRYTAENTAMHNNVPRKGGGDGGGVQPYAVADANEKSS